MLLSLVQHPLPWAIYLRSVLRICGRYHKLSSSVRNIYFFSSSFPSYLSPCLSIFILKFSTHLFRYVITSSLSLTPFLISSFPHFLASFPFLHSFSLSLPFLSFFPSHPPFPSFLSSFTWLSFFPSLSSSRPLLFPLLSFSLLLAFFFSHLPLSSIPLFTFMSILSFVALFPWLLSLPYQGRIGTAEGLQEHSFKIFRYKEPSFFFHHFRWFFSFTWSKQIERRVLR